MHRGGGSRLYGKASALLPRNGVLSATRLTKTIPPWQLLQLQSPRSLLLVQSPNTGGRAHSNALHTSRRNPKTKNQECATISHGGECIMCPTAVQRPPPSLKTGADFFLNSKVFRLAPRASIYKAGYILVPTNMRQYVEHLFNLGHN